MCPSRLPGTGYNHSDCCRPAAAYTALVAPMRNRELQCLIEALMAAQAAAGGHAADECRNHGALYIGPDLFSDVFLTPNGEFFRVEAGSSTVVVEPQELAALRAYAVRTFSQFTTHL